MGEYDITSPHYDCVILDVREVLKVILERFALPGGPDDWSMNISSGPGIVMIKEKDKDA